MSDRISKVTTRAGDKGNTKLATGRSISKTSNYVRCVGAVDELNSHVGLALAHGVGEHAEVLKNVQQTLFDMGAVLAMEGEYQSPDLTQIEAATASVNETLPPLTEFVLPGGGLSAAQLHICRTTCRRAEVEFWALLNESEANAAKPAYQDCARYLNRLSDYFFVLARACNQSDEEQWRGPSRS
ncbi:MAG: cob(I)yrinic acid a,c-diamide adenosyltransferase [Pseudomonadota bacterium]